MARNNGSRRRFFKSTDCSGVNLKALAVPPFLLQITVGPRSLSFALLHACRYDPVIWSSSETLSGRLCEPEEAEEGTGISAEPDVTLYEAASISRNQLDRR